VRFKLDFSKIQIWKYPYLLKRLKKANAQVVDYFQSGCLIKIQDENGHFGYADICPWTKFGDLSVEEELMHKGPLFNRALQLASEDLNARKNQIKLVNDQIVLNNILINDYNELLQMSDSQLNQYVGKVLKIKCDDQYQNLVTFLNQLVKKQVAIKIRLDFNFCLSRDQFDIFLNLLSESALKLIEYIEDPFVFEEKHWQHYHEQIPLFLDWENNKYQKWNFLVIKPSREEVVENKNYKIALTSSMEHPVGFVHGLRWAQKYPYHVHGFSTLSTYETTEFNYFFEEKQDQLRYFADGYGIGFTNVLNRLNWIPDFNLSIGCNFLLSGHRLSDDENFELFKIKQYLEHNIKINDCILIPSSGSSQKKGESVKVVVLSKSALYESAKRVNNYFKVDSNSCWGCVLPLFHVGGLGVYIRATLADCRFEIIEWSQFTVDWIKEKNVSHLSLVPTQLFEIVQNNAKCPDCVRFVFIGGAHLDSQLAEKAKSLGWPIIQTFGMTETGSMIAVKVDPQAEYFDLLPGVEIKNSNRKLLIKSKSNAKLAIKYNRQTQTCDVEHFEEWLQTQDEALIENQKFKFLQREFDYVKIKGEGVSLYEIRNHLYQVLIEYSVNPLDVTICDFPDVRDGCVIRLVVTENVKEDQVHKILSSFNQRVRPYEKINTWIQIDSMPKTEMNKIKFSEIRQKGISDVKKI